MRVDHVFGLASQALGVHRWVFAGPELVLPVGRQPSRGAGCQVLRQARCQGIEEGRAWARGLQPLTTREHQQEQPAVEDAAGDLLAGDRREPGAGEGSLGLFGDSALLERVEGGEDLRSLVLRRVEADRDQREGGEGVAAEARPGPGRPQHRARAALGLNLPGQRERLVQRRGRGGGEDGHQRESGGHRWRAYRVSPRPAAAPPASPLRASGRGWRPIARPSRPAREATCDRPRARAHNRRRAAGPARCS